MNLYNHINQNTRYCASVSNFFQQQKLIDRSSEKNQKYRHALKCCSNDKESGEKLIPTEINGDYVTVRGFKF